MIRQFAKGMLTTLSIDSNDSVIVIHRTEKRRSTAKRRHLRRQAKIRERSRYLKNDVDDPLAGDDDGDEITEKKYTNETLAMAAPRETWSDDITGGIFLGEHAHLYDMWKVKRIVVL
jgi:galactokinase